jgi:hypothetical protein
MYLYGFTQPLRCMLVCLFHTYTMNIIHLHKCGLVFRHLHLYDQGFPFNFAISKLWKISQIFNRKENFQLKKKDLLKKGPKVKPKSYNVT